MTSNEPDLPIDQPVKPDENLKPAVTFEKIAETEPVAVVIELDQETNLENTVEFDSSSLAQPSDLERKSSTDSIRRAF